MSTVFEEISDFFGLLKHSPEESEQLGICWDVFKKCVAALKVLDSLEDDEEEQIGDIQRRCMTIMQRVLRTKDVREVVQLMNSRAKLDSFSKVLTVNAPSRDIDEGKGMSGKKTRMFAEWQARPYEVVLRGGLFCRMSGSGRRKAFSTLGMESHGKANYGAYVISVDGRIYVFDHLDKSDLIAHSSFVRGAPVLTAGEIRITNGYLMALTAHSGHYRPDNKAIQGTLLYFRKKGVSLSGVALFFVVDPKIKGLEPLPPDRVPWLFVSTLSTFKIMKEMIEDDIAYIKDSKLRNAARLKLLKERALGMAEFRPSRVFDARAFLRALKTQEEEVMKAFFDF